MLGKEITERVTAAELEPDEEEAILARIGAKELSRYLAGEIDVEHEAAWREQSRAIEERLGRCERLRLPARRTDQQLQRLAHRYVVVDDEDRRERWGDGRRAHFTSMATIDRDDE